MLFVSLCGIFHLFAVGLFRGASPIQARTFRRGVVVLLQRFGVFLHLLALDFLGLALGGRLLGGLLLVHSLLLLDIALRFHGIALFLDGILGGVSGGGHGQQC